MLEGLTGVICVAYNILVNGKGATMEEAIIDQGGVFHKAVRKCLSCS